MLDPDCAKSGSTSQADLLYLVSLGKRGGKSGHQAMWLWFGSLPFSWLFGIPFFGVFAPLGVVVPSLPLVVAMLVVLAGMGLAARSALNY